MFKLDHGGKDKEKLKKALPSLTEIQEHQSGWKDDFQLNSALRRKFRVGTLTITFPIISLGCMIDEIQNKSVNMQFFVIESSVIK